MVKKRVKGTKKAKAKSVKKVVKSKFNEKKIKYADVKSSVSPNKDLELNKELKELEDHTYYGQRPEQYKEKKTINYGESKVKKEKIYERHTFDDNGDSNSKVPSWFYMGSIFAAFLFTVYISIFATLHFENIAYMNIMIIFLFLSMISFFLISMVYHISKKRQLHAIIPALFFLGISSIMIYAFKAVDTSNLLRFSIIYTIIVVTVSAFVLIGRR